MTLKPFEIERLANRFADVVFVHADRIEESIAITPDERDVIVAALRVAANIADIVK
jgi:hypothetical protein